MPMFQQDKEQTNRYERVIILLLIIIIGTGVDNPVYRRLIDKDQVNV
jgi:hypothetical protein